MFDGFSTILSYDCGVPFLISPLNFDFCQVCLVGFLSSPSF